MTSTPPQGPYDPAQQGSPYQRSPDQPFAPAPDPRDAPTPDPRYTPYAQYEQPMPGADPTMPGGYGAYPGHEAAVVGWGQTHPGAKPPSKVLGWGGVAVLYLLVIWQLVIPTVQTFLLSLQRVDFFSVDDEWVGLENWSRAVPDLLGPLGFAILLVLPLSIVAALLGAMIATAMAPSAGTSRGVRVVVGVLTALFVPLGVGLGQMLGDPGAGPLRFDSPGAARLSLIMLVTAAGLPLLTALFATTFGASIAARQGQRMVGAVVVVGVLGVLAASLQVFDLPRALTAGGPQQATTTPMLLTYIAAYVQFDLGYGAAISAVLLLVCGALGIGAVVCLLATRPVLAPLPQEPGAPRRSGALGLVLAALVLVVALLTLVPLMRSWFGRPEVEGGGTAIWAMWGPTAIGTVIQVALALLGGAAIGWFQPAGRRSLWLLLPLAPWVFVGYGPLSIVRYLNASEMGQLNTFTGLIPPLLVPWAVIVFALLFAGLRSPAAPRRGPVIGAAVAGIAAVLLVTQAQSTLRPLLFATDSATMPATLRVLAAASTYGSTGGGILGLLYPIPVLLVVIALGVLAQLGTRRLALQRT